MALNFFMLKTPLQNFSEFSSTPFKNEYEHMINIII